jgi:hypothetical protein
MHPIGVPDWLNGKHDLLELIIGPEYIGDLSRALADHGTGIAADSTLMQQFPCHIGFCRDAVRSAA